MEKRETLLKTLIFSSFFFIILLMINFVVFWFSSSNLTKLFSVSLWVSLALLVPAIFYIYAGIKRLKRGFKAIFSRMVAVSFIFTITIAVILSLILFTLLIDCSGEECMGMLGYFFILGWVLISLLISAILSIFVYLINKKKVLIILIVSLILILLSIISFLYVQAGGCILSDTECFIKKAINGRDPTICDNVVVNQIMSCYFVYASSIGDRELCNFDPPEKVKDYYGPTFETEYSFGQKECLERI